MLDENTPDSTATVGRAPLALVRQEAKKVRDGINALSIYEKMLAREQLAAVTRLVEAVERL